MADLDHVVMAVEMDAVAGAASLAAGDHVPAWMGGRVARRALGPDEVHCKALPAEPFGEIVADFQIVAAGRVERGNADQVLRQHDEIIAPRIDFAAEVMVGDGMHEGTVARPAGRGNGPKSG